MNSIVTCTRSIVAFVSSGCAPTTQMATNQQSSWHAASGHGVTRKSVTYLIDLLEQLFFTGKSHSDKTGTPQW